MSELFGYGKDFLTLWALNEQLEIILRKFEDETAISDCLVFYRPSFGRSGGAGSAEFGEFDAIVASRENIYLIESKWDNLSNYKKERLILREEQLMRHKVFDWYLIHWSKKYVGKWQKFVDDNKENFIIGKKLPNVQEGKQCILATNLEFILCGLLDHCREFSSRTNIKNVLLFFYNSKFSTPPTEVNADFTLIPLDYSKKTKSNFIEIQFCHSKG
jgi:hypothetical protein